MSVTRWQPDIFYELTPSEQVVWLYLRSQRHHEVITLDPKSLSATVGGSARNMRRVLKSLEQREIITYLYEDYWLIPRVDKHAR